MPAGVGPGGGSPGLAGDDGSLGALVAIVALAVTLGWFGFGIGVVSLVLVGFGTLAERRRDA